MPPARSVRQHIVVRDQNNENGCTTRLTRAKAAAVAALDENSTVTMKKPLQSRQFSINTLDLTTAKFPRKRAVLGDVSNVNRTEAIEGEDGTKLLNVQRGLLSKTTQHAGVQKLSGANSSRLILGTKDNNNSSQQLIEEETPAPDLDLSNKTFAFEIEKQVELKVKEVVKVDEAEEEVPDVKQAFSKAVQDLDLGDANDPLMVAEYVVEIFDYLKVLEKATMPNAHYMDHQDDLEWKMRGDLVDWLIEVHTAFHLLPETLFLAVNIIDRFLSAKVVQQDRLQLVGVTAMFIASKYEEVISPQVTNFSHVTDNGFTDSEILRAERCVLAALNYDLSYPNPMNFLRRISKADSYDIQTRTLGKYLIEISLVDHRFMKYHPSRIAAAAMYLSRLNLERGDWDPTLIHYSGYSEEEIQPVFKLMVDYLHRPVAREAFFKKYASKKFLKASILTRQWVKKYYPIYLDGPTDAGHGEPSLTGADIKTEQ